MKEGCGSFISHGNQATSGYDPKIRSWPRRQWPTKAERRGRATSQKEEERHETIQCWRRGGREGADLGTIQLQRGASK